ncbi:MAG: ABC transporter permease [Candidatus Heimdallarchaeota archaeon]|nr:ABC transporter permease [Candidatus Heimdallarchaeota archaeon]
MKATSLAIKDLKEWYRKPFLIVFGIAPIFVVSLLVGVFVTQAEILPAGIILQDNDPLALELKDYLVDMRSGTGDFWFEMTVVTIDNQQEVLDLFEDGDILAYIVIPLNISLRLADGEMIPVLTHIHNIQDDITKNVMQRMEHACNHINRNLVPRTVEVPEVEFTTISAIDISFRDYVLAAVCALAVLMPAGANIAIANAQEFEKGTIKELIMAASPGSIILGKFIANIVQTFFGFGIILLFQFLVFGYFPSGNFLLILGLVFWGILSMSGLGLIVSTRIKQLIPSAIAILMFNILGWYVGGGLVPPEVWKPAIRFLSTIWPGTYFFRSFITLVVFGTVNTSLLVIDLLITGIFGLITFAIAFRLFTKEVYS